VVRSSRLLRTAAVQWWGENTSQMGAALAFYSVFTIAPVLVLSLNLIAWTLGPDAAQSRLQSQLESSIGLAAAQTVQSMVVAASQPQAGRLASVLSWLALIYGASGMFFQMQTALNAIWEVETKPQSLLHQIRAQLVPFLMVFVIAALILILVVVSAVLSSISQFASERFPTAVSVGQPLNAIGSLAVLTLLFALIFKFVPQVQISWQDVWVGAFVTALLFAVGKQAISFYMATAAVSSAYGAAGSVTVLLLWAYYSSQILFFGAEITQAYAQRKWGHHNSYSGNS